MFCCQLWHGLLSFALHYVRDHWRQIPWFRMIMFVVCGTMCLIQCTNMWRHYNEFNFAISIEEEYRENIIFPGVTVCVDAWLDTVRTCAFTNGKCSRNDLTYTIGLYYVQNNPDLRKFGAFPPGELFDCILRHPSCQSFQCKDSMKATYFRPPSQLCYTVDVVQYQNEIVSKCASPWMYEMELKYRVNRSRVITFMPTHIYPLVVHPPNTAFPDLLTAVTLQPGTIYELAMKQTRVLRLKAPYKSRCDDYFLLGYRQEYGGYLNFDLCLQNCSIYKEFEICRCVRSNHEYAGHQRFPLCNFTFGDTCAHMLHANRTYDKCDKVCGMPCKEIAYDLKVVGLGAESGTKKEIKDKFTLRLSFGSESEEVTKYVPALTYTECLAYTGAYMGTWIGISLLDTLLGLETWYNVNKRFLKRSLKIYLGTIIAYSLDASNLFEENDNVRKTNTTSRVTPEPTETEAKNDEIPHE